MGRSGADHAGIGLIPPHDHLGGRGGAQVRATALGYPDEAVGIHSGDQVAHLIDMRFQQNRRSLFPSAAADAQHVPQGIDSHFVTVIPQIARRHLGGFILPADPSGTAQLPEYGFPIHFPFLFPLRQGSHQAFEMVAPFLKILIPVKAGAGWGHKHNIPFSRQSVGFTDRFLHIRHP